MFRRALAAASGVVLLVAGAPDGRAADGYRDPEDLRYDADNSSRTTERQARHDSGDLRAHAGVVAVGDWAGLNAEPEHGVVRDG